MNKHALLPTVLMFLSCGEPLRTPGYHGEDITESLTIRFRIPEGFQPDEFRLDLEQLNTQLGSHRQILNASRSTSSAHEGEATVIFRPDFYPGELSSAGTPAIYRPMMRSGQALVAALHDLVIYWNDDRPRPPRVRGDVEPDASWPFGPAVPMKPGYQLIRRVCDPAGDTRFELVPPGSVLELVTVPVPASALGIGNRLEAEALSGCGLALPPESLGTRLEVGPPSLEVEQVAFQPGGNRVAFLPVRDRLTEPPNEPEAPQIDAVDTDTAALQTLTRGSLTGPLRWSADGRYLFFRTVDPDPRAVRVVRLGRLDTSNGQITTAPAVGLPSPDGKLAAFTGATGGREATIIGDLETGMERSRGEGTPLAWAADSGTLLLMRLRSSPSELVALKLDGTEISFGPAPPGSDFHNWFWSGDSAHTIIADDTGFSLSTVSATASPKVINILPSGESPTAPDRVAVAATAGAVFVWSRTCEGLDGTWCTARLHRYLIAQGTRSVVAVARAPMGTSVTPDGKRLALSGDGAIFVKDLPAPGM